jgi:hypothetical protein
VWNCLESLDLTLTFNNEYENKMKSVGNHIETTDVMKRQEFRQDIICQVIGLM